MSTYPYTPFDIARHESAHAVVAVILRRPFARVSIAPGADGSLGRVSFTPWGNGRATTRCKRAAITYMVGRAENERLGLPMGEDQDWRDTNAILEPIAESVFDLLALMQEAEQEARRLIARPDVQRAIDALAEVLVRETTIEGQRAKAIIKRALAG